MARRFFLSKEHLSKVYKLKFGENITEHIIRMRMELAKSLILRHDIPIKYIAHKVGYEDVSYFHKVFKRYHGMTPAEMRNACKRTQPGGTQAPDPHAPAAAI